MQQENEKIHFQQDQKQNISAEQQSDKNTQKTQQAQTQNVDYRFSSQFKQEDVKISNDHLTAYIGAGKSGLALVDGVVLNRDTTIRFKIQSLGHSNAAVGLAIRNVVAMDGSSYAYKLWNTGYFIIFNNGQSYSHSNKEQNQVETDFSYTWKDVIRITTKGDQLVFLNENSLKMFKMNITLTQEEWSQACFCAYVNYYSQVSILK